MILIYFVRFDHACVLIIKQNFNKNYDSSDNTPNIPLFMVM